MLNCPFHKFICDKKMELLHISMKADLFNSSIFQSQGQYTVLFPHAVLEIYLRVGLPSYVSSLASAVIYDEMFQDTRHHVPDGMNLAVLAWTCCRSTGNRYCGPVNAAFYPVVHTGHKNNPNLQGQPGSLL